MSRSLWIHQKVLNDLCFRLGASYDLAQVGARSWTGIEKSIWSVTWEPFVVVCNMVYCVTDGLRIKVRHGTNGTLAVTGGYFPGHFPEGCRAVTLDA